uniref:Guanine nucleotide-binding protein subunit beta-like protein n=1 Tax=Neobodo designis TaxID=312471 RepID=A0A7S1Q4P9_NEODS
MADAPPKGSKESAMASNPPAPADFVDSAHIAFGDVLLGDERLGLIAAAHGKTVIVGGLERPHAAEIVPVAGAPITVDGTLRCVAVDARRGRIAVGGDAKSVHLYNVTMTPAASAGTAPTLTVAAAPQTVGPFNKRIVALCFDDATGTLYAGDKFGELYRATFDAQTGAPTLDPKMVLSHMSMLTHVAIRKNALVTCDRDGCIRVSKLDFPDEVRGFLWTPEQPAKALLGDQAEDTVTASVAWLGDDMVTGSLDGLVTVWRGVANDAAEIDGTVAAGTPKCFAPAAGTAVAGLTGGLRGLPATVFAHYDGHGSAFVAAADGAAPKVVSSCDENATVVAAAGPAMLLRDGSIAVSYAMPGEDTVVTMATPLRFDETLDDVSVTELWHTRQPPQVQRAADDVPSAKKGPRAEATA